MVRKAKSKRKTTYSARRRWPGIRRRRNISSTTSRTPGLGNTIVKGVKSLLSYVPGSKAIAPFVDFGLKMLGWVTEKVDANKPFTGNALEYGLVSVVKLNYANLLSGSSLGVDKAWSDSSVNKLCTTFTECRLINVNIKIIPNSALGKQSGTYCLAFFPFVSQDDEDTLSDVTKGFPSFEGLQRSRYFVSGPITSPLSVKYQPNIHDGRAWQFNPLQYSYGMFVVRLDDVSRAGFGDFTADEFGLTTVVSGSVECRTPQLPCGWVEYSPAVTDVLKSYSGQLTDREGNMYLVRESENSQRSSGVSDNTTVLTLKDFVLKKVSRASVTTEVTESEFMVVDSV